MSLAKSLKENLVESLFHTHISVNDYATNQHCFLVDSTHSHLMFENILFDKELIIMCAPFMLSTMSMTINNSMFTIQTRKSISEEK